VTYATIDDLRSQLGAPPMKSQAYTEKMLHPLPDAKAVDRAAFLLERCTGKRVLEFGASGPMHDALVKVASVVGIDRESVFSADGRGLVIGFDLDDVSQQTFPDVPIAPEVIVCGEVLEHLGNPGWCLTRLKRQYAGVPVILTVPNAFTTVGRHHLQRGIENVNIDHVAWYSPRTLKTLLERHGFEIHEFYYYGGVGHAAEGLVVVAS
jgi:hypothetical protein